MLIIAIIAHVSPTNSNGQIHKFLSQSIIQARLPRPFPSYHLLSLAPPQNHPNAPAQLGAYLLSKPNQASSHFMPSLLPNPLILLCTSSKTLLSSLENTYPLSLLFCLFSLITCSCRKNNRSLQYTLLPTPYIQFHSHSSYLQILITFSLCSLRKNHLNALAHLGAYLLSNPNKTLRYLMPTLSSSPTNPFTNLKVHSAHSVSSLRSPTTILLFFSSLFSLLSSPFPRSLLLISLPQSNKTISLSAHLSFRHIRKVLQIFLASNLPPEKSNPCSFHDDKADG